MLGRRVCRLPEEPSLSAAKKYMLLLQCAQHVLKQD